MRSVIGWKHRLLRGGEEGQGLAYVLVLGAVLLIFLTALVNVLVQEERWVVGSLRRSQLVNVGDAAVDRAIYKLQLGGNWDALGKGLIAGYHQDVVYTDQPGILYTIQVLDGNWTPTVTSGGVSCTGYQIGNPKSERTITVFLTKSNTGEKKKIQAVVIQSALNAAIFSGGQIVIGGSADAHWGPVVSYSTASDSIPLPNTLPDHPIFESVGGITIGGSPAAGSQICIGAPTAGNCVWPGDSGLLPMPPFDFTGLRITAQNSNGIKNFYDDGANSCTWTGGLPSNMQDGSIVFYDTCDHGNYNPVTDSLCGSKSSCGLPAHGADVKVSGSWCGTGFLIVQGDLTTDGTGCTMAITMTPPPDCSPKYETPANAATNCVPITDPTLFWNGTIYVAGNLKSTGNKKVYGTVDAYNSAGIKGNFSIWFKTANATLGYLGKTVSTEIWMDRKPMGGDIFP